MSTVTFSVENNVKKVIALSTDKAANPINLYGASKLASDKLFVAANNLVGPLKLRFAVVRYGNVVGSRGSVVHEFNNRILRGDNTLPVTHKEMTRFWLTLDQGVNFSIKSMELMKGGEIFVPKIPSYRIIDVVKAINPSCKIKTIGIRPGEKLHEEMITSTDSKNTVEYKNYYVILPVYQKLLRYNTNKFLKNFIN